MVAIDLQTTTLEQLLALVQADNEILLVEGGTPLARISPIEEKKPIVPQPRIPDLHLGAWMSDDFTDPFPDEF